jgi:hypothetical protein
MLRVEGWQTVESLFPRSSNFLSSGNSRSSHYKALDEAYYVKVATQHMGLIDNHSRMKPLDNEEYRAPDTLVALSNDEPIPRSILPVEVVQYTQYSRGEDLVDFLERTKLSPIYQYEAGTMIVCAILEDIGKPEELALAVAIYLADHQEELMEREFHYSLVLLFMNSLTMEEEPAHVVIQVFPELHMYEQAGD